MFQLRSWPKKQNKVRHKPGRPSIKKDKKVDSEKRLDYLDAAFQNKDLTRQQLITARQCQYYWRQFCLYWQTPHMSINCLDEYISGRAQGSLDTAGPQMWTDIRNLIKQSHRIDQKNFDTAICQQDAVMSYLSLSRNLDLIHQGLGI